MQVFLLNIKSIIKKILGKKLSEKVFLIMIVIRFCSHKTIKNYKRYVHLRLRYSNAIIIFSNKTETTKIRQYQKIRSFIAEQLLHPENMEIIITTLITEDNFKIFIRPEFKDVALLPKEKKLNMGSTAFKTIHATKIEDSFLYHLLIAILYFQPWQLDATVIFSKTLDLLDKREKMAEPVLKILIAYSFFLITNYITTEEADAHVKFVETALTQINLALMQDRPDQQTRIFILNTFQNCYTGCMPMTNHSDFKKIALTLHDIQRKIISLRLQHDFDKKLPLKVFQNNKKKIRIGLLSINGYNESHLFFRIFKYFDHNQFELHLILHNEKGLEEAKNRFSDFFIPHLIKNHSDLEGCIHKIRSLDLDILFNGNALSGPPFQPEISFNNILTCRVAPIQLLYMADVYTSGIKNIDGHIMGEAHKQDNTSEQFVEKIYFMPGIGHYMPILTFDSVDKGKENLRDHHNIPSNSVAFVSHAHVFKLSPELIEVWIEILKLNKNSILVLAPTPFPYMHPYLRRLKKVIEDVCKKKDVLSDRIVIKYITGLEAHSLLLAGDIYLDSFPYSGPTSTLEALAANLPTVTMTAKLWRSNLAAAVFKELNLNAFIATSKEEYIELATKFANSKEHRDQFTKILRRELPIVKSFNDPEYMAKELEKLLLGIIQNSVTTTASKQSDVLL